MKEGEGRDAVRLAVASGLSVSRCHGVVDRLTELAAVDDAFTLRTTALEQGLVTVPYGRPVSTRSSGGKGRAPGHPALARRRRRKR